MPEKPVVTVYIDFKSPYAYLASVLPDYFVIKSASFPGNGAELGLQDSTRASTTVAFLMEGSDLLPGGWERVDERRVD